MKYDYTNKQQNLNNYIKYNINRCLMMFKYCGLPDTIPQTELEHQLLTNGYSAIIEHEDKLYCLPCGLLGLDEYNNPLECLITNAYLQINKSYKINKECILIENDFLRVGLLPLLNRYCTQLLESDITMILANITKRTQTLISANDDRTQQSGHEFINQLLNGKLGIIAETQLFDSLKAQNFNTNTSMKDLIEYHQFIKSSMYNELGLNSLLNMKRERLNVAEVESNTGVLYPLVDSFLHCRQKAIEKINKKWNLNITIDFNSSWNDRIFNDEQRKEKFNNADSERNNKLFNEQEQKINDVDNKN